MSTNISILAVVALIACGEGATRVELTINKDAAVQLDDYQLRIVTPTLAASGRADVQPSVEVVVPDGMAGTSAAIEVWGLSIGRQIAYGTTTVTPELHGMVSATVTLTAVSCGLWCEPGDVACDHDGVTECKQDAMGCFAWSAPMACPSDAPYCSNGTCGAQCSDECSSGDAMCDSEVAVRTCGEFDSDPCLDRSPATACPSGASCSDGVCEMSTTCTGCMAPPHGQATCTGDTCDFTCDAGWMKSGGSCALVPPAPMPTARQDLVAALGSDGLVYAIGGWVYEGSDTLATVEAYNPATNTWVTRAPLPSANRSMTAVAHPDGRIYVIGGGTMNVAYNPATNTWSTRAAMPTARDWPAAALGPDGLIYVMGGTTFIHPNHLTLSTVEAYNPATNSWTTKASLPGGRWAFSAATGSDGRIYVFGGYRHGDFVIAEVDAYDTTTNTWIERANMPIDRWMHGAVAAPDGRIYVMGGDGAAGAADAYDVATNAWIPRAPMSNRSEVGFALGPNLLIYAIGGSDATGSLSTVQAFDPVTNTWY
jgi:hypothetical protein